MLNDGRKVARKGWNGKGMYLQLVYGGSARLVGEMGAIDSFDPEPPRWVTLAPFIVIYALQGGKPSDPDSYTRVPWTASQADMLARDWVVVE